MKNRDMFYQNMHTSYTNTPMFMPPNGYNINQEYQAYGPNMINNQNNDYDNRITALEKQIRSLDNRLQKLESASFEEKTDNFYMI